MTDTEKKPRTREEQYKDPRFARNLSGEVHIASGISIFAYAEEYETGLPPSSSPHDHSFLHSLVYAELAQASNSISDR